MPPPITANMLSNASQPQQQQQFGMNSYASPTTTNVYYQVPMQQPSSTANMIQDNSKANLPSAQQQMPQNDHQQYLGKYIQVYRHRLVVFRLMLALCLLFRHLLLRECQTLILEWKRFLMAKCRINNCNHSSRMVCTEATIVPNKSFSESKRRESTIKLSTVPRNRRENEEALSLAFVW